MSAEERHACIREIEKAGGEITCRIDDSEHVVTVRLADGRSIEVRNAFAYDIKEAMAQFTIARFHEPKAEKPTPHRKPPARTRQARTRVALDRTPTSEPATTERLPLRERLKQRNTAA